MCLNAKSNGHNCYRNANNLKDTFTHRNGYRRTTSYQKQQQQQRNSSYSSSSNGKKSTSTTAQKSVVKWKIIISSIILLLCRTSHVHAIRKGRLMSPSSFTALSGDLHVQIQYSGEYDDETTATTTTTTSAKPTPPSSTTTTTRGAWQNQSHSSTVGSGTQTPSVVENTIMSTLVISKFIDEVTLESLPELGLHERRNATAVNNNNNNNVDDSSSSSGTTEHLLQRKRKEIVQNIPLYPDPRNNVTQIAVPCQTFMRGGLYEMQVITNLKTTLTSTTSDNQTLHVTPTMMTTTTLMPVHDERLRQTLDVRWPSAEMIVSPVRLRTYPENPVEVTLRFPEVNCERALHDDNLPEFWLELVYCGKERSCADLRPQNITKANILYAEQVRGYPKSKTLKLKCELFGLAGNYAVQLRPLVPAPNVPITRRFLSVDWSDKFVFNVYARSIFPCDPHTGIGVLYEYPSCILEQGDRVRVYAKLRADVASLKPPTTLHYVAEQRVVKSQYSLYFNCDLFTEKYVEYCFVYVSQAISGAVADVRMDCVPTLPVSDSDTGGWGPWSEWTACSTNCLGGTRNRYRFCDSPPPRYGAKFCEGPSVETEKCGKSISDTWDCIYETSGTNINKANRTEVSHEIGPGCRCGCIVHLGSSKPKRIIAGATQSCPGRSLWLIQVDGEETISLNLNFMRLPCATQYIKIRDGPSFSSTLLVQMNGGGIGLPTTTTTTTTYNDDGTTAPSLIESSGAQLLVEFFAGDEVTANANATSSATSKTASSALNAAMCTGGFMANVEQLIKSKNSSTTLIAAATRLSVKSRAILHKPKTRTKFTLVHLSAVVFASIIILISGLLGAQYVVRYRKYHLAIARRRDEGSRLHTPRASLTSLQSPPSRAVSTTTLLSEVIYMVKMRPKHQLRHSILRESVDAEQLARETEFNELGSHQQMIKCEEHDEFGSNRSIVTLRNELASPVTDSRTSSSDEPSPSAAVCTAEISEISETADYSARSGTLTRKDSAKDNESIISSGMSSLCNSPPMNTKRLSKYSDRYDAVTLKIRNSRLDDSLQDSSSLRSGSFRLSQLGARSASASLTNGCYSPATSTVSTATIRTTNPKESKEKQNRKKLLARPGSEFSLGNQEDLELDYYDYNVINAGAAPGSYLGMDPAYLIWIPPFDELPDEAREDDDKTPEPASDDAQHEPDETEPLYEEIKIPRYGHYLSPCSNTESSLSKSGKSTKSNTTDTTPTSDELSPLNSSQQSKATTPSESNHKNSLLQKTISAISAGCGKPSTPYMTRKQRRQAKQQSKSTHSLGTEREPTMMRSILSGTKSAREIVQREPCTVTEDAEPNDSMSGSYVEKETSVVKSPSDLQGFLAIDDIQFADESESDYDQAATLKRQSAPEATSTKDLSLETAIELQTRKTKLNDYARVPTTKAREFAV